MVILRASCRLTPPVTTGHRSLVRSDGQNSVFLIIVGALRNAGRRFSLTTDKQKIENRHLLAQRNRFLRAK